MRWHLHLGVGTKQFGQGRHVSVFECRDVAVEQGQGGRIVGIIEIGFVAPHGRDGAPGPKQGGVDCGHACPEQFGDLSGGPIEYVP